MTVTIWLASAAGDKSSRLLADVLPWLVLLIGVVLIGAAVIYFIRRLLKDDGSSSAGGFTLHDLRELHAAGELTDEQFERAKAMMIGRLRSPQPAISKPDKTNPDAPSANNPGPASGLGGDTEETLE